MTYTFFEPCNFLAESGVQSAQRDSVSPRCAEGIIANPVCEWSKLRGAGFQVPFLELSGCGVCEDLIISSGFQTIRSGPRPRC